MSLDAQLLTLIWMMVGGLYLGVTLDTFRRLSVGWKERIIWSFSVEVLFWVFQTIVIFYLLYTVNYGEIRIYILLALLLGFSMYVVLFKAIYKRILERTIQLIRTFNRITLNILNVVLFTPIKWIVNVLIRLVLIIINLLLVLLKFIFYPFLVLFKRIYEKLPQRILNNFNKTRSIYSTIKDKLKR